VNDTLPTQEQELRSALKRDLRQHADRTPTFFIGFVIAWVTRKLPLTAVEDLLDQIERVHPAPQTEPVRLDDQGWPILRPSDPQHP
jgi:hypothetical protein